MRCKIMMNLLKEMNENCKMNGVELESLLTEYFNKECTYTDGVVRIAGRVATEEEILNFIEWEKTI